MLFACLASTILRLLSVQIYCTKKEVFPLQSDYTSKDLACKSSILFCRIKARVPKTSRCGHEAQLVVFAASIDALFVQQDRPSQGPHANTHSFPQENAPTAPLLQLPMGPPVPGLRPLSKDEHHCPIKVYQAVTS